MSQGDKTAFAELLTLWRAGQLSQDAERILDEALARVPDSQREAFDTAAGQALLEQPARAERRQGLAALLAGSGSQLAAQFLVEAARHPETALEALASLATVADPEVLPVYRAAISQETDPALLEAIGRSLRQMETPKARELEQRLAAPTRR